MSCFVCGATRHEYARTGRAWETELKYLRNGFTIIELMVTVAIIAILVALAIPDFQRFIQKARIDSEILDLQSFLMRARGEAIKLGQDVWIDNASGNSERWAGQLRYFGDDGNKTQGPLEPTGGLYRAPTQIVLEPGDAIKKGIGYNSRGELIGEDNTENGSLYIKVPNLIQKPNYYVGVVRFNSTGRTTVIRYKNPASSRNAGVDDGGWN